MTPIEEEYISSDSELACEDYCQYDAGHNCRMCDRFENTRYMKGKEKKMSPILRLYRIDVTDYHNHVYHLLIAAYSRKEALGHLVTCDFMQNKETVEGYSSFAFRGTFNPAFIQPGLVWRIY